MEPRTREELLAEIAELQERLDRAEGDASSDVPGYRGYMNKADGNEHSRVIDVFAADPDEAQAKILALRADDEVLEQIVSISVTPEHVLV